MYSFNINYSQVYENVAKTLGANEDSKLAKKSAVFRLP